MDVVGSPLGRILTNFYEFDIPQTPKARKNSINFNKLIGGDLTPEVRNMLKVASQQRITLIQGLSYAGATPAPSNVIAAANAYLPSVWRIQSSLEFSKSTKIHLTGAIEFEWSTVLAPSQTTHIEGVFIFEVSYVLMIRSLAGYNFARALMGQLKPDSSKEDVMDRLKRAMQELKVGAGTLDYLAEHMLPNWRKPPANPPPEVNIKVVTGLRDFFLCMAQRLFIVAALITGKVAVVPRLLGGLSEKYDKALRSLMSIESFPSRIKSTLYEEPEGFLKICKFATVKYKGIALYEGVKNDTVDVDKMEDSMGMAVAFLRESATRAKGVAFKPTKFKDRIQAALAEEVKEIQALRRLYEDENNSIYYGKTDIDDLPDVSRSENVFNLTPVPFKMPEVTPLSFEEIPKPKDFDEPIANFNTKKHPTEQITDDNMFIPPGVDVSVFKALSTEMQAEIVQQYFDEQDAQNKAANASKDKKGKKSKKKKKK